MGNTKFEPQMIEYFSFNVVLPIFEFRQYNTVINDTEIVATTYTDMQDKKLHIYMYRHILKIF